MVKDNTKQFLHFTIMYVQVNCHLELIGSWCYFSTSPLWYVSFFFFFFFMSPKKENVFLWINMHQIICAQ